MKDMTNLIFKFWDLCEEFYKNVCKIKRFYNLEKGARKSRIDGHRTSRIFKCSVEGTRLEKFLENPDEKRKPKELTRCNCYASIQIK